MNVISILFDLILVGLALYLVEVLIPMDPKIKKVIQVLVCVAVLYYVLQVFGLVHGPAIYLR